MYFKPRKKNLVLITKQKAPIEFYQKLGELFYAVAAADKCVHDEELNSLKNVIKKEWLALEDRQVYCNNSETITILNTFKTLHNDPKHKADFYFNRFINFKRTHGVFFNKKMNALILSTAAKIANSFSGQNKSELIMLSKLHIEFNKNDT